MSNKLLVFICFSFFSASSTLHSQGKYQESTTRSKEQMVQQFPFEIQLKSPDGKMHNSAKLFGKHKKPTVLLFWLTTCGPCRMEVAAIQSKYAKWMEEEKFRFVLISYDFPQNYDNYTKRASNEKWPWETYHDVNREFGKVLPGELNGLPQVFVFDKDGQIAYHKRKYLSGDEDLLFAKIKSLNAQ